jgi:hypothetical protein
MCKAQSLSLKLTCCLSRITHRACLLILTGSASHNSQGLSPITQLVGNAAYRIKMDLLVTHFMGATHSLS